MFPMSKELQLCMALNSVPVILTEFHFTGYKKDPNNNYIVTIDCLIT